MNNQRLCFLIFIEPLLVSVQAPVYWKCELVRFWWEHIVQYRVVAKCLRLRYYGAVKKAVYQHWWEVDR